MKRLTILAAALALVSGHALAKKDCDELKNEIRAKLDKKGVKRYALDIVDAGKEGDAQTVGSCDGGTKKIVYRRD